MPEEENKKLEGKVRKYRLICHNVYPNDEAVNEMITRELGKDVEVVYWEEEGTVNYKGFVPGASCPLPQHITAVMVKYKELKDEPDCKTGEETQTEEGNYHALYIEGQEKPVGVLSQHLIDLGVMDELSIGVGRKFYVEPVTKEQAEQIRADITGSESSKNLIDRVRKGE